MVTKLRITVCPYCRISDDFTILCWQEKTYSEDEIQLWELTRYEIVECNSCQQLFVRDLSDASYNEDMRTKKIETYPREAFKHTKDFFSFFDFGLAEDIRELSGEIDNAINHKSFRLAAMGTRTLILLLGCKLTGVKYEKFSKCIADMKTRSFITKDEAKKLNNVTRTCSAAVHDNSKPTETAIVEALGIINRVFEHVLPPKPPI